MRAVTLEHFRDRAPAIAALALEYYREPQASAEERAAGDGNGDGQSPDDKIDETMQWKVLARKVEDPLLQAVTTGADLAGHLVGEEAIAFGLTDEAATRYAEQRAAEMVGMRRLEDGTLVSNPNAEWAITEKVRTRIHETVTKAVKEGWTGKQLADELEGGGIWEARADAIARTEVAMAVNQGAADTYKAAGVVDGTVLDGPGCLEDGHDDSQAGVNGETWTVAKFEEFPVGHPHCRRDFAPNVPAIEEAA
jgi:hypothetical protein